MKFAVEFGMGSHMVEVVLGNERPEFALPDRLPGP